MSTYRSSADGPIVRKGKTKGTCIYMKGDTVGGPTGGGFKPRPTTMPHNMPMPKGS